MSLLPLIANIQKMIERIKEPTNYGTELEAYIVSKNPQSTYDVEYWTTQFDKRQNNQGWTI